MNHIHQCISSIDCAELYSCIEGMCQHKAFWPPTFMELIGMLIIAAFSGFASLAGIGGGGVMVSFMTFFFNYSQKEALLAVFIPIFGAALGNFLNLVRHADPQTKTPVVQIRSALLACPIMIVGSVVGLMINKFLPAFFLVIILEYFIGKSLIKFYRTAKKEWATENNRRMNIQQVELQNLNGDLQDEEITIDLKDNLDVFLVAGIIVLTVLCGFLLRGSKEVSSIIGVSYCGLGYWFITILIIGVLYKYFYMIDDKFKISHSEDNKKEFFIQSFKAGIINGFGLGGGMFLIPMYLSFGYTAMQSTGTSSFNVLLSSFQAASQVIILGLVQPSQAFQLFILTLIGCFCSSSQIFKELKKRDRLSIIMWGLCGFCSFAMLSLGIEFLHKWSARGYLLSDLFNFQSLC